MSPARHRYRQTLLVRINSGRPIEPVVAALNEWAEARVLRIVDLRLIEPKQMGTVAAITVEHLWWNRLLQALMEADGEMISDLETPKPRTPVPSEEELLQIQRLDEMRRVGTLTEAEFLRVKRTLLPLEEKATAPEA